jgi:mRNA interferase RelE/StbE
MEIFYGKTFSKDLDNLRNQPKVRKNLLDLIKKIKAMKSLREVKDIKKLKDMRTTFGSRLGITRLGFKLNQDRIELIRFLHRKEIYRRFP